MLLPATVEGTTTLTDVSLHTYTREVDKNGAKEGRDDRCSEEGKHHQS